MNYRFVFYTLGMVLNIAGFCMLLPLLCALLYSEPYAPVFLISIAACFLFGIPLTVKRPKNRNMYAKEGFVIVASSWIVISLFGALPFMLSGFIPNFFDALFETVSGFTTTGASILTSVEPLPKCLLFWRSFTHWLGGMGVLVFLVAILPSSGGANFYLLQAESTGANVSKLVPKVKSTAKLLYTMYLGFTLAEIICLLLGGLPLFDSLTLTFGTVGTGGFGILDSSAGEYSSYVQWVITVFMILCGIDFSIYHMILLRKFKSLLHSEEARYYLGIIFTAIVVICVNSWECFNGLWDAIRHAAFQVGSLITTTGFSTVDFNEWRDLSKTVLLILMFIGACAGSTGGGIKVSRIVILIKSLFKQLKITIHPKRTYKITMNGRTVEHETLRAINVFLVAYLTIFIFSLLVISRDNLGFTTNFTAVLASLNNIGPGLDLVGPAGNFSCFSWLSKLTLTFCMLFGRLEVFPMLVLFARSTWKK